MATIHHNLFSATRYNRVSTSVIRLTTLFISLFLAMAAPASAQETSEIPISSANKLLMDAHDAVGPLDSAPVVVNGEKVFQLIGVSAYPAKQRALKVSKRITRMAKDETFDPKSIKIVQKKTHNEFWGASTQRPFLSYFDEDAALEGVDRNAASAAILNSIKNVIKSYRKDRQPDVVRKNLRIAVMHLGILVVGIFLINRIFHWLLRFLDKRVRSHIVKLEAKSLRIIQGRQLWSLIRKTLRIARLAMVLVLTYISLNSTLSLFPQTRYHARNLLNYVLDPLKIMAEGFVGYLPNLFFLILLYLVVKYILKIGHQYFSALERGQFEIDGFDAEWALPTYRIVRVVVILFAVVIAYPHIPGSDSQAFKGLSILVGVLFSLGSSSVVSNIIAGYTMTYRSAFKIGDRVSIAGTTGDVSEMRVLVTHLRSLKNEEVVIPNSTILNNEVINYSKMAEEHGLILHTVVGIGYEVPWRQVEEMLKMAADRTEGLLKEPPPFVLQQGLADFAVNYEINAYCHDEKRSMQIYTELHRNIQDVFNEHEVQIMTPNYVADTPDAKIVPEDQWFAAPAKPPGQSPGN